MNNNFVQRTIAGALLVVLILSSIWFSPYGFLALFSVITVLSTIEFHKITNNKEISVKYWVASVSSVVLFIAFFVTFWYSIKWGSYGLILYGLIVVSAVLSELFRKAVNPINNVAYFLLGQCYIALPLALLNFILFGYGWRPILLIALFVTIWLNDTCAYLVGSQIGKHSLFKRISPKKSWEGFFGGAIGALLSGYLFYRLAPADCQYPLWFWLVFAEIVVVFGTLGDLIESLIKRTVGVKDSGHIIPGHGGMLDRFDSLLLSAPLVCLFIFIVSNYL